MRPHSHKNGKDIDKRILEYLVKQDWPVTTEMVAKELKVSWNTAQLHLYKLMADNMVKGRRIGRQNQWIINREKRQN
jgi:predicted transcriptional regulator